MTKEEKQLLLIDLCARLPHKVKIKCDGYPYGITVTGVIGDQIFHTPYFIGGEIMINKHTIDTVRPYLRPLSSMTEEEKTLMTAICLKNAIGNVEVAVSELSDFYNSRHFDFRGLIPNGLALEAPKDMYKTE